MENNSQPEKIVVQNSRLLTLVGDFYHFNSDSAIIFCHGFASDRHEAGMFDRLAIDLNNQGHNVFTFDFSGCGDSDDDYLSLGKEIDDLNSIIRYVKSKGFKRMGVLGYSLGGLVALSAYSFDIKTMVLLSPVTNKMEDYAAYRFNEKQIKELNEKGYARVVKEKNEVRMILIVDRQMVYDRESVNQEKLLTKIKCPVLVFHGDEDKNVPLNDSKSAMNFLSPLSFLIVVPGEGHELNQSLDFISAKSIEWFKRFLV